MGSLIGWFSPFYELLQYQKCNLTEITMDCNLLEGSLISVSRLFALLRLKVEALGFKVTVFVFFLLFLRSTCLSLM